MINVVFVCLGNICRSPMAEIIFRDMVEREGLSLSFCVSSRGTSDCEEGSPMYAAASRNLLSHGLQGRHTAQKITLADIKNADYILCMDGGNFSDILRLTCGNYAQKVFKLCDFTSRPRDVADPWYTLNFEQAYRDITDGCRGFLSFIKGEKAEGLAYDKRH